MSCNKKEATQNSFVALTLNPQKDKVVTVDIETDNRLSMNISKIDTSTYIHFFNRNNRQLYIHDFYTNELIMKVPIYKEGPDGIRANFFQYYIHNLDSIFINPNRSFKYVINSRGEVINTLEIINAETPYYHRENLVLDDATNIQNGRLLTGRRIDVPELGASNTLRTSFNLKTSIFEDNWLEEKVIVPDYNASVEALIELNKARGISHLRKYVAGSPDHLFASSQVSDSIYEYKNSTLVQVYYAGDPKIKITSAVGFHGMITPKAIEGGVLSSPSVEKPPYYTTMFMDADKEWLYRVLIHGAKAHETEGSKVIGASLIGFNLKTKMSNAFEIPIDSIRIATDVGHYFATKEGVHFSVKDQDIETVKRYKVFKIE